MDTALEFVANKLPEEVRAEYKREIGKELNSRKNARNESREAFFASEDATKQRSPIKKIPAVPPCSFANNLAIIEKARKFCLQQFEEANIIGFREGDGDMFYIKYREEFAD